MAKANLVLPDGTTVAIEGTAEEVAVLLTKFSLPSVAQPPTTQRRKKPRTPITTGGGTEPPSAASRWV